MKGKYKKKSKNNDNKKSLKDVNLSSNSIEIISKKVENYSDVSVKNKRKLKIALTSAFSVIFILFIVFICIGYYGIILQRQQTQKGALFSQSLLAVSSNGKWGYISTKGKTVIDFKYEFAFEFSDNGLALVWLDGNYGFINKKGKMVIENKYEKALSFNGEIAICKLNGNYGAIDKIGGTKVPFIYENLSYSNAVGKLIAKKDGNYGIIDTAGQIVIDFDYSKIDSFNGVYLSYKVDGKYKLKVTNIDLSESDSDIQEIEQRTFENIVLTENGYVIFSIDGKYGLISPQGKFIVDSTYKSIEASGKYLICKNIYNYYGLIGFDGIAVTEFKYQSVENLNEFIVVKYYNDDKFYVVTADEEILFNFEADSVTEITDDRIVVLSGGKYGVMDKIGNVIISAEKYDYISKFYSDGLAIALCGEKYGVIDKNGNEIISLVYDNINLDS